jgi:ferritin-like metal-binding protein YciE
MKQRSQNKSGGSRSGGKNEEAGDQQEESNNELRELFVDELCDIHNAEQQLIKALPKMAEAANSEELRMALESHLEETKEHAIRLEQVFEGLGESIKKKKCKAMEGLLKEGEEIMDEFEDSSALDAALIAAGQKVEHYEIATYGTLATWAELLDETEAAESLTQTLEEEKAADEKLTGIAESVANQEAEQG